MVPPPGVAPRFRASRTRVLAFWTTERNWRDRRVLPPLSPARQAGDSASLSSVTLVRWPGVAPGSRRHRPVPRSLGRAPDGNGRTKREARRWRSPESATRRRVSGAGARPAGGAANNGVIGSRSARSALRAPPAAARSRCCASAHA